MKKTEKNLKDAAKHHQSIATKSASLPDLWRISIENANEYGYKNTKYKIASKRYKDALGRIIEDAEALLFLLKKEELATARRQTREKLHKEEKKEQ